MNNQYSNILISLISFPTRFIGLIWSLIHSPRANIILKIVKSSYYTGLYCRRFNHFGKNSTILKIEALLNSHNIKIGNNTNIEKGALLRCYPSSNNIGKIYIGNNVNIGLNSNISSCNKVVIKDNVLIGRNVMINDNSHGSTSNITDIIDAPIYRPIVSKGPIIIGENVWIGENVAILGGVRVGHNSIIGANSVVTKDIPSFCIAGGVPARIIKRYE